MLIAAKICLLILMKSFNERIIGKIYEGEMLFQTSPATLLQIFCKIILNFQVIVRSIGGPDDNFWRSS